jgi:hypothetical protein
MLKILLNSSQLPPNPSQMLQIVYSCPQLLTILLTSSQLPPEFFSIPLNSSQFFIIASLYYSYTYYSNFGHHRNPIVDLEIAAHRHVWNLSPGSA